jgi:hypothetical protein
MWTILSHGPGYQVLNKFGSVIAVVKRVGYTWRVEFVEFGGLNFEWSGGKDRRTDEMAMNKCFGYVRGIERAMERGLAASYAKAGCVLVDYNPAAGTVAEKRALQRCRPKARK